MERQKAIQILAEAGRTAEVVEIIESHHRDASSAYAHIADDPDITEDAKRRREAAHYVRVMESVTRELSDLASRVRLVDHDDAGNIFGVKGLDGDPASLAISRRDAADRVAACESGEEVRELLERATRQGDEVLARACVENAVAKRDAKTANQYLETRPEHEEGLQRLWDQGPSNSGADFRVTMAISGLRPARLQGIPSYEIERLAQPVSR